MAEYSITVSYKSIIKFLNANAFYSGMINERTSFMRQPRLVAQWAKI